jgi:hypothetical protein
VNYKAGCSFEWILPKLLAVILLSLLRVYNLSVIQSKMCILCLILCRKILEI